MDNQSDSLSKILKDIQAQPNKNFDIITKSILIHAVLKYRGNYTFSCVGISQALDIPLRSVQTKVSLLKEQGIFEFSHTIKARFKPCIIYKFNRTRLNSLLGVDAANAPSRIVDAANAPSRIVDAANAPSRIVDAGVDAANANTNEYITNKDNTNKDNTNELIISTCTEKVESGSFQTMDIKSTGTGPLDWDGWENDCQTAMAVIEPKVPDTLSAPLTSSLKYQFRFNDPDYIKPKRINISGS